MGEIKKYKKKPVIIEAIQFTEDTIQECWNFTGRKEILEESSKKYLWNIGIKIETLEGTMWAKKGDWIIKGINGEFYPCKPNIFEKTYEEVEK